MIKKLTAYVKEYKKYAVLAPITVALEVLLEVFIPFLMAKIIDVGIANHDIQYVTKIGALMITMALVSLTFGALSGRFAAIGATGFGKNLRGALFHKIQDFSFANIDKFNTSSLITRLTTDITNVQMSFMMVIRIFVRAPIMLIIATFMAVKINAQLSRVFIIATPLLSIALALIIINAFPRFQAMLKKYDGLNASVQENLIAIRMVKSFVRRDHENQKLENASLDLRNDERRAEKIIALNMPAMMLTVYSCILSICWFGGNMIVDGNMLTGQLMSFISYVTQILMSLMMISFVFVMLVLSKASAERIIEVMEEEIDIQDNPEALDVAPQDGSISFEGVSFSYAKDPDNLTLQDINLQIRSGETIGIIGGTGSAKTTLVQLIPRLYDVFAGSVSVGGHDVRDYKIQTLRDNVAMVLQNNLLFSGTIRQNLLWGDDEADQEEIEAACKKAAAHDFILSLPDGYDTMLGQGGVNVSGGQKQRLCIARALLKKPKIMILDDSTSAVDTATDSSIRQALQNDLAQTTKIIIAQRIASVSHADRIIVMNEGRIEAIGSHEELLRDNPIYQEIFTSQQKGVA